MAHGELGRHGSWKGRREWCIINNTLTGVGKAMGSWEGMGSWKGRREQCIVNDVSTGSGPKGTIIESMIVKVGALGGDWGGIGTREMVLVLDEPIRCYI